MDKLIFQCVDAKFGPPVTLTYQFNFTPLPLKLEGLRTLQLAIKMKRSSASSFFFLLLSRLNYSS